MDDAIKYIESVAKAVNDLDLDPLLLEPYEYRGREIIIAVSSNHYTLSRNYLKIYEKVYKTLPHFRGLGLPTGVANYVFVDLSWGAVHKYYREIS